MKLALLILFYLIAPYFIILLTKKYALLNKIGAVLLSYAFGFVIGLTDLLPEGAYQIQDYITSATVPLALPLLLFGTQLKSFKQIAKKSFLSMLLAIIALTTIVTLSHLLLGGELENDWQVGGLLMGLYTGGTPNLASIQLALDISPEIYLMVNTYDIILTSVFLLTILSTGGRFLNRLLPRYKSADSEIDDKNVKFEGLESESYLGFFRRPYFLNFLLALAASVLIAGVSLGLSFLITGGISMLVVMLGITSFSLIGSLVPKLNKCEKSFEGGMYLILVFSLTVASMVKPEDFINISPNLFWFVSIVIFGSFLLHVLFSAIFRIDSDTTLITATAMICSPPFVPVVAGAIKNKSLIVPGLTVGIIGYAIGNYLGVLVAYFLYGL